MLMLTMMIMGAGTFLIGCLPTYKQIGVSAPITLIGLRLLQGIGIGGEWGGATLMVIEHASHGKRGFFGSRCKLVSHWALRLPPAYSFG
jgi:MHS family shikimate/dehydroshikimate transporter-like MFS transporter